MAQVVCFDAVAQRRHQEQLERDEDLARRQHEAEERIKAQLVALFLAGANGYPVRLPYVLHSGRKAQQPFIHGVMDTLDFCKIGEQLLLALRESECHHVHKLKTLLAQGYAAEHAPALAKVEVSE